MPTYLSYVAYGGLLVLMVGCGLMLDSRKRTQSAPEANIAGIIFGSGLFALVDSLYGVVGFVWAMTFAVVVTAITAFRNVSFLAKTFGVGVFLSIFVGAGYLFWLNKVGLLMKISPPPH